MRANKENLPHKINTTKMIRPYHVVAFSRLLVELEAPLSNNRKLSGIDVALERTGLTHAVVERMGRGILSGHNAKKILTAHNRMNRLNEKNDRAA